MKCLVSIFAVSIALSSVAVSAATLDCDKIQDQSVTVDVEGVKEIDGVRIES